jgi:cytoskeletal protein CcmA (bactofilin family)
MTTPMRSMLATLAAMILLLAMPSAVAAGEYRTGGNVTIGADETIDDDLYVAGGTLMINGAVEGDLTVAGGTIDVRGPVSGSVNVAGGTVSVSGPVGGAVRSASGTVSISGDVGRDVVLAGGDVTVAEGATVGGDVAGAAGSVTIAGAVGGDVLTAAGEVEVLGSVDGRIDANAGQLRIGPEAVIAGDVLYASEAEAEIAAGADIGGSVERREPEWAGVGPLLPPNPIVTFLGALLGLLVLGWGLMLVRPGIVAHPGAQLAARPLPSFGVGLAVWGGQFLLLIALFVLTGLASQLAAAFGGAFLVASIVTLLLLIVLIFVSQVFVAMGIGAWLGRLGVTWSPWLTYAAGATIWALVLMILGLVPGPLAGLLFVIGWMAGLGALALHQFHARRGEQPPTAPPHEPASATAY